VRKVDAAGGIATDLVTGVGETHGVAVTAGRVFYRALVSGGVGELQSVTTNGGSPTTEAAGFVSVLDVAKDGTHIYFTDAIGDVMRVPIFGGSVQTLASGQLEPVGVAVNSTHVFWGKHGGFTLQSVPKSGGAISVVMSGVTAPLGVDATDDWVCVTTDELADSDVHCVAADGSGATIRVAAQIYAPLDLRIDGNYVYWASDSNGIFRAPIEKDPPIETVAEKIGVGHWGLDLDDVAVYWVADDGVYKIAKPVAPSP
jgi:hypothetical protein